MNDALSTGTLVLMIAALSGPARGHDLITAQSAQVYLTQAQQRLDTLQGRGGADKRAEAAVQLGRMLDEIRDLLNRDLAAHGRIQGLATEHLVQQLKAKGLTLEVSPDIGRIPANTRWYREALRLAPDGASANQALFGVVQGEFYDSFEADPLKPHQQTWSELKEQIGLCERFMTRAERSSDLEEAKFILTVLYTRAASMAPEQKQRAQFAAQGRAAIAQFQARYADSLRAAALPVLLDSLDHAKP
jgi:hypothetical protein